MAVDQACNQEFFRTDDVIRNKATSRIISASTNKQKASWGKLLELFHLSKKTTFLMKNITIDYHNLGIFPKKQGHSLQFPEKSRGDRPLLPGTLRLVTYFKIFMSPKNVPEVSRIYGSYFGWRVKYSEPRKKNLVNELKEI